MSFSINGLAFHTPTDSGIDTIRGARRHVGKVATSFAGPSLTPVGKGSSHAPEASRRESDMELQRTMTVAVGGVTKRFEKGPLPEGTSSDVIRRLQRAGAFGDSPEALGVKKADEGKDVGDMTVEELKAYAEANSIDLGDAKLKADIVAKIEAADAA